MHLLQLLRRRHCLRRFLPLFRLHYLHRLLSLKMPSGLFEAHPLARCGALPAQLQPETTVTNFEPEKLPRFVWRMLERSPRHCFAGCLAPID